MSTQIRRRLAAVLVALVAAVGLTGYAYHVATVTGRASVTLNLTETVATNLTGISATVSPGLTFNQTFTAGTGVGAIDVKWCDRRTIAASAADTLDLAGSLTNEFGATVTFAKVKALGLKADAANTNDVWVGGAAANRFNAFLKDSSVVVIRPGYTQLIVGGTSGYTVTAGSGDKLLLKNSSSGTGVSFDICIGGTSA